jgi:hypothetical protein
MRQWGIRTASVLAVLAAAQPVPLTVFAQGAPAGTLLTLGVSTDLRVNDNLDLDPVSAGSTVSSDTRLSFGLLSETPLSTLSLSGSGLLRAENEPGTGFATGFEDPSVNLSYTRDGANAAFSFEASFDRTEIDGFTLVEDEEIGVSDLILDTGTRDNYRVGTMLEIGSQAPLGFVLELERSGTMYNGTTDPGLYDRFTDSASATAVLRFSPVTTGQASLDVERFSAEDAVMTTRDTRALRFGLAYELSETTVIEASLGSSEIDDSVDGVTRGFEAGVTLTHELPLGAIAVSFNSELTTAGRRSTLEARRSFIFPAGTFEISVGAVDGEDADPQIVGGLTYNRELRTGEISASLSRNVSVNVDSNVQKTTRATLGLSQELNTLSSVAFNLDYIEISDSGGGAITGSERGTFSATYQRDLTEDWNLSIGYQRRYLSEAGASDAWDNVVFLTLDREFSWMP